MNKKELVFMVSEKTGVSQSNIESVFGCVSSMFKDSVRKHEDFKLPGFGIFKVKPREARTGVNPSTGEKIEIQKMFYVKFRPMSSLRNEIKRSTPPVEDTQKDKGKKKK